MSDTVLDIRDLHVSFSTPRGRLHALVGVDLSVRRGESIGLVGETGSGKTVTALSVLGLLPPTATVSGARLAAAGVDLLDASPELIRRVRGGSVAMIFQNPDTSLNPVFTIGKQLEHVVRRHLGVDRKAARDRVRTSLEEVGLPDVVRVLRSYPHELSGGMKQRAMIAMALSCEPELLVADEPTTALDVTVQAQILELLREIQQARGLSILHVTHDLGVVADSCDRVGVMYAGRIVELGPTTSVLGEPRHPYTRGLLDALPRPGAGGRPLRAIGGTVPSNPGAVVGCPFAPRCPERFERCDDAPGLLPTMEEHQHACHLPA
jgi:oligopeptide/dipeptide ABC transporter ATP-binding protein